MCEHDRAKETGAEAQKQSQPSPDYQSGRQGSTEGESPGVRNELIRISGQLGQIKKSFNGIGEAIGGTIDQSLEQARQRLKEFEDCVVWYVEAKVKVEAQIEQLEALKAQFTEQLEQIQDE
ncbi:MAG: hypothetical protein ACFBSC_08335 [Microcoleaceae cyanobacterium]